MYEDKATLRLKKFMVLLIILVILWILYTLIYTVYIRQTTGTLVVNSPGAFLTIEQDGSKLANIGVSTARVRLKSGNYILIASKNHVQVDKNFLILKGNVVTENFSVKQPSLPQASSSVVDANKLINYLPFIGPNFDWEVNYKYTITSGAALPVITITTSDSSDQQAALNWITALGFNPNSLNIVYIDATPQPLAGN